MRVFVAGTNVALGVTLTRRLLAAGHEVIGLSRTPANRDNLLVLGADYRWSARVYRERRWLIGKQIRCTTMSRQPNAGAITT